jgi:hypothetical protein
VGRTSKLLSPKYGKPTSQLGRLAGNVHSVNVQKGCQINSSDEGATLRSSYPPVKPWHRGWCVGFRTPLLPKGVTLSAACETPGVAQNSKVQVKLEATLLRFEVHRRDEVGDQGNFWLTPPTSKISSNLAGSNWAEVGDQHPLNRVTTFQLTPREVGV